MTSNSGALTLVMVLTGLRYPGREALFSLTPGKAHLAALFLDECDENDHSLALHDHLARAEGMHPFTLCFCDVTTALAHSLCLMSQTVSLST